MSGKTLYHYTSQKGLLGIVGGGSLRLWATNIRYLNDSLEFYHAFEIAHKSIKIWCEKLSFSKDIHSKNVLDLLKKVESRFSMYSLDLKSVAPNVPDFYVFSFSAEDYLLSQWRAYCPKNGGFSIGFDSERLKNWAQKVKLDLVRCCYDCPSDPKSLVNSLLLEFVSRVSKLDPADGYLDQEAENLIGDLYRKASCIKDCSFQEENEWRLVSDVRSRSKAGINYREGTSMIIPYYEFEIGYDEYLLEEIIVGPTPHRNFARESVVSLLESRGIKNSSGGAVPVKFSKIPFRGW